MAYYLYEQALQEKSAKAIEFLSRLPAQVHQSHAGANIEHDEPGAPFEVQYLIATAGSGKTFKMFTALTKRFGFYLVSGAAPYRTAPQSEDFYRPHTRGASGDTQLLFDTWRYFQDGDHWKSGWDSVSYQSRCSLLLQNRLRFFLQVREQWNSLKRQLQPWHWLCLQFSFDKDTDYFRRLYRLILLTGDLSSGSNSHDYGPMASRWDKISSDLSFLWCLDEVQCEISMDFGSQDAHTTLSCLFAAGVKFPGLHNYLVAGTALKVFEILVDVKFGLMAGKYSTGDIELLYPHMPPVIPLTRFDLVQNDDQFKILQTKRIADVFEVLWAASDDGRSNYRRVQSVLMGNEHILDDSAFLERFHLYRSDKGLFDGMNQEQAVQTTMSTFDAISFHINRYSIPLRGRYRWSVRYIEKLLSLFIEYGQLTEQLVRDASKYVQDLVKLPLRQRIEAMATLEDKTLVQDVFEMALQADLFGRSRILKDAGAALLIEQAIGYVEYSGQPPQENISADDTVPHVSLAERLVVDAVMDYLKAANLLESLADEKIAPLQYSASGFGFYAEEHLARSIHAKTIPTRQGFLSAFDEVYNISETNAASGIQLHLEGFSLAHDPGQAASRFTDSKDVAVWMRQVRQNEPRETFLLPSTFAGPDVIFLLHKKTDGGVERLVCAVQVRETNKLLMTTALKN